MTGTDLIVLAPWLVFAAGVGVICGPLIRARYRSRRHRNGASRWSRRRRSRGGKASRRADAEREGPSRLPMMGNVDHQP
jgi:hypothetical protein